MNKIKDLVEESEQRSEQLLQQGRRASLATVGLMGRLAELDLKELFDELVATGREEDVDLLIKHPLVMAGLGALVKARDEGGALFNDLVKAGEAYSDNHFNKKQQKQIESDVAQQDQAPQVQSKEEKNASESESGDLTAAFEQAQRDVKSLTSMPDNKALTALYGHYKQATQGDVTGDRPGITDFVARAKWDAWKQLQGKSAQEAMQGYIDIANRLLGR